MQKYGEAPPNKAFLTALKSSCFSVDEYIHLYVPVVFMSSCYMCLSQHFHCSLYLFNLLSFHQSMSLQYTCLSQHFHCSLYLFNLLSFHQSMSLHHVICASHSTSIVHCIFSTCCHFISPCLCIMLYLPLTALPLFIVSFQPAVISSVHVFASCYICLSQHFHCSLYLFNLLSFHQSMSLHHVIPASHSTSIVHCIFSTCCHFISPCLCIMLYLPFTPLPLFFASSQLAVISSLHQESEGKTNQERQRLQLRKMARRRSMVPPWLQTVAWMPEVRLLYKLPTPKVKSNLKKDRDWLKKMGQPGLVKTQLRALLEEVDSPDHVPPVVSLVFLLFYVTYILRAWNSLLK